MVYVSLQNLALSWSLRKACPILKFRGIVRPEEQPTDRQPMTEDLGSILTQENLFAGWNLYTSDINMYKAPYRAI